MTKITWRGAEGYAEGETPPRSCTWGGITFPVGVAVEVDDPGMVAKAKGNRFFKVEDSKPTQWREPDTEADPADCPAPAEAGVSFYDDPPPSADFADVLPDYPPEDQPKRKRGRPPRVNANGNQ